MKINDSWRMLLGCLCCGVVCVGVHAASKPGNETGNGKGITCDVSVTGGSEFKTGQTPVVVIPEMSKAPRIDGCLDDEAWGSALRIGGFLLPATENTAVPETQALIGFDSDNLYFGIRCSNPPGKQIKTEADGKVHSVFNDDSIELFLWPIGSTGCYYQIGCNSECRLNEKGLLFDLESGGKYASTPWKSGATAKSEVESDYWTIEIAVPLNSLGIDMTSAGSIRFNVCRNFFERDGSRIYSSWVYLPVLNFHSPACFGVGVLGHADDSAGATARVLAGMGKTGILDVTADSSILIVPEPCQITLDAHFPRSLTGRRTMDLRGRLVADGVGAEEFAFGPVAVPGDRSSLVTLNGVPPGNYNVSFLLSMEGMEILERTVYMQVREPVCRPVIDGAPAFEDSDWRGTNAVSEAKGVERQICDEVLLKSQFKSPVTLFRAGGDESVTCIRGLGKRLYLGTCTRPAMTDSGSIYEYDPDMAVWREAFQVNEQGLARMKVHAGKLYIPGYDANDGGWDLGNIYVFDGENWVERRTVPFAVHIYGIAVYHDRIYVSAGVFDKPPAGMKPNEAAQRGLVDIYGRVLSSGDGGKTWREDYRTAFRGQNSGYMEVFDDRLVLNAEGDIVIYDGKTWEKQGLMPDCVYVFDYCVTPGALLMGTSLGVLCYDGKEFWRPPFAYPEMLRGVAEYGENIVMVSYHSVVHRAGHGPGGYNFPSTAKARISSHAVSIPSKYLVAPLSPREFSYEKRREFKYFGLDRGLLISCRAHRGRLYFGSHPDGEAMVLPVVSEGSLVSAPKHLESGGTFRLVCDCSCPPGTAVKLDLRYGESLDAMHNAIFAVPGNGQNDYREWFGRDLELPDDIYVQYRLKLETGDPATTPYVQKVALVRRK